MASGPASVKVGHCPQCVRGRLYRMRRPLFDAMLSRTPLLSGMDLASRDRLVPCFEPHAFTEKQRILTTGSTGRLLGVLLEGHLDVQAREEDQVFTVDVLGPGDIFGEISFFDGQSPRTADVVGQDEGLVALLAWSEYEALTRLEDPAAEVLEKAVLDLLARRIQNMNRTLDDLMVATRDGSWLDALRRFLGMGG